MVATAHQWKPSSPHEIGWSPAVAVRKIDHDRSTSEQRVTSLTAVEPRQVAEQGSL